MNNNFDDGGFSLIEIIIVVSLISTLSAIVLVSVFKFREKAADQSVKTSMINSFKECKNKIVLGDEEPRFTLDFGLHFSNGFYNFYQKYDYVKNEDGSIPPTTLGNCIGPLGPHKIGVIKHKGKNIGGELWLNLNTGVKTEKNGLTWD